MKRTLEARLAPARRDPAGSDRQPPVPAAGWFGYTPVSRGPAEDRLLAIRNARGSA